MGNVADQLFWQAFRNEDKLALVYGEERYTFAEIAERVATIAAGLKRAGLGVGSRVGLMMSSRPDFIFHQQAAFAIGATVSPLNIFYRRHEVVYAVQSCDLEYLIVEAAALDRLPDLDAPGMESMRGVFVVDGAGLDLPAGATDAALLVRPRSRIAKPATLDADAIVLMLHTSATTGKAKGVMLSLANLEANYDRTPGWLGITRESVILCALPLYNTFGLNQCINATMVAGCTLVLMPRFDAERCLEAIEAWRCSFFPAVPTMLQKLFDHPTAAERDLSSMQRIMTGAAPVPAALLERIRRQMGEDTVVMTGYGLTEATAIVSLEHIELGADGRVLRPKSIGHVLPGIELSLLGTDGAPVAAGAVGEICVRGPNVMQGYYRRPEDTAVALDGGWLHTGDLGMLDPAGYVTIVDRMKDVIIRGGQNVYPADIEEALYRAPGVREAAVVGRDDDLLGEVPIAFVALVDGGRVTPDDLVAWCRQELAHFKVPASVSILPELPKGPTGKILRRELKGRSPSGATANEGTAA